MMRETTTDYQATNARGVIIQTFSDADLARKFARDNQHLHTGLTIQTRTVTVETRRFYTPPKTRKAVDFSIPQWGAVSPVCAS